MEHLSQDFGNLGLSRGSSGGAGGANGSGQWPRAQAPPSRSSPPQSQGGRSGYQQSSSRSSQEQQGSRGSGEDWKQLESDLNAATAKEFVPGNAWGNQHSSNSSVGSNSQGMLLCRKFAKVNENGSDSLLLTVSHS